VRSRVVDGGGLWAGGQRFGLVASDCWTLSNALRVSEKSSDL